MSKGRIVVQPAEMRVCTALFQEAWVSCAFACCVVTCSGGGRGGGAGYSLRRSWAQRVREGAGSGVSKSVVVMPAFMVWSRRRCLRSMLDRRDL